MIHDVSCDKAFFYLPTVCLATLQVLCSTDRRKTIEKFFCGCKGSGNKSHDQVQILKVISYSKYWIHFQSVQLFPVIILFAVAFVKKSRVDGGSKNQSSSINNNARFFHQYISLFLFFFVKRYVKNLLCFVYIQHSVFLKASIAL